MTSILWDGYDICRKAFNFELKTGKTCQLDEHGCLIFSHRNQYLIVGITKYCHMKFITPCSMGVVRWKALWVSSLQSGMQHNKLNVLVDFPLEGLNMTANLEQTDGDVIPDDILYDLMGVVNHYGTMTDGHYTGI